VCCWYFLVWLLWCRSRLFHCVLDIIGWSRLPQYFYCQATGNSYVSIRAVCRSLVFIELYYILVSGISISFCFVVFRQLLPQQIDLTWFYMVFWSWVFSASCVMQFIAWRTMSQGALFPIQKLAVPAERHPATVKFLQGCCVQWKIGEHCALQLC
jgi:hypothetical protein